jgi:gamma-glutamyl phosphate reductase
MTTVIIQSNSEKKTRLLIQLAEELGLSAQTQEIKDLNTIDVARGIGRKATDEELINYLNKDIDEEAIPLDKAFAKYTQ